LQLLPVHSILDCGLVVQPGRASDLNARRR
jgi:hypothetical protein